MFCLKHMKKKKKSKNMMRMGLSLYQGESSCKINRIERFYLTRRKMID